MSKIVAIGNLKGGTGKSTVAVNLAYALARPDRSVLLLDADAQGTASDWLKDRPPPVEVLAMPLMAARDTGPWISRLMALRDRHAVVVIDLPPQVDSGIASALLLADVFVVPVTPSGADLRATGKALELLQRARAARGGGRPACLLVPSKVDRRTALGRRATTLLDRFGLKVGPTIRQQAAHVEAFDAGTWVGAYAPDGPACAEVRALAKVVEGLLDLAQGTAARGSGVATRTANGPADLVCKDAATRAADGPAGLARGVAGADGAEPPSVGRFEPLGPRPRDPAASGPHRPTAERPEVARLSAAAEGGDDRSASRRPDRPAVPATSALARLCRSLWPRWGWAVAPWSAVARAAGSGGTGNGRRERLP